MAANANTPAKPKPRKSEPDLVLAPHIKLRLNLRFVVIVDFRFGVMHHYDELKKARAIGGLGDDECCLLISQTGRRLAFLFPETKLARGPYDPTRAITSFEIKLDKTTPWNPTMLSVYAEQCGIELNGIKKFEEYVKHVAAEKEKGAA